MAVKIFFIIIRQGRKIWIPQMWKNISPQYHRIMQEVKCPYSSLENKQKLLMNLVKNRSKQEIDITKILCNGYKTKNVFVKFKTTQSFGDAIRNGIIV